MPNKTPVSWLNGSEDEKIILAGWVSRIISRTQPPSNDNAAKDHELKVAENIARVLIKDLSLKVRVGMAQKLLVCPTLPTDIVQKIATDVEAVASPFLEVSSAFSEAHLSRLIPIIQEYARVSVAKRKHVPSSVGVALINFSSDDTVTVLMQNKGAEINKEVCDKMVDRYEGAHPNMEMLANRIDLPEELAKELMAKLSSSYIDTIDENYISKGSISDHLGNWINEDPRGNIMGSRNIKEIESYVQKLHKLGRLTPEIILNSLTHGNKMFFEVSMAILTGTNTESVNRLITRGGLVGLEGLLYKAKISKLYLKRFSSVLEIVYRIA